MAELLAFGAQHVCHLTGLTMRQLRYWDDQGFFPPRYADENRHRPFSRVYSFRDVVGLRTLALLRNRYNVPLQELRKAGSLLKERYQDPWARLTFYVLERRVIFKEPRTGLSRRASSPDQLALPIHLDEIAHEVKRDAERMRERQRQEIGRVTRNRYVVRNAPVIAGTRIPTAAIWDFHQEGYTAAQIIEQYPRLEPQDVEAAISYEKERRQKRAG